MAVSLTGELWLKVGQAHMVRPVFRIDHARMRAYIFDRYLRRLYAVLHLLARCILFDGEGLQLRPALA
jgi:hypothetical protein